MIRRFLAVVLAMLVLTFAPGHLVGPSATPPPVTPADPGTIEAAVRSVTTLGPASADQPGLFASDPILRQGAPAGPFALGTAGTLAVVGVLPDPTGQSVLVALRNLTADVIVAATVTAIIATASVPIGGATDVLTPAQVAPDGLAFAQIPLEVPPGTITAQSLPTITVLGTTPGLLAPQASITSVAPSADGNQTLMMIDGQGQPLPAFIRVVTICFTEAEGLVPLTWTVTSEPVPAPETSAAVTQVATASPSGCGPLLLLAVSPG
ncbi:MAG TPA: hypothetical protein VGT61_10845 [Thermomicrobiales bacterium]|nr:hypothetical protein [Thermomicrobiales bacterium]